MHLGRPAAVWVRQVAAPTGPAVAPAEPPAALAKPAAASGYNFVWRNFCGTEKNPNGEKNFLGDTGPSGEVNAANSVFEYFNLSIDQNLIYSFCLKTNRYANQNGVAGFEDVALVKISFVAMNIVMATNSFTSLARFSDEQRQIFANSLLPLSK